MPEIYDSRVLQVSSPARVFYTLALLENLRMLDSVLRKKRGTNLNMYSIYFNIEPSLENIS